MLNDEQLKTLLEVAERAAKLRNARLNEARSEALMRFQHDFGDPATCAELVREVIRLRKEIKDAADDLKSAANEARWSAIQGDEYGSY
jgi:hypothetical protein